MTNRPLSSADQFKVLLFLLLSAAAAAFLVGIPPLFFVAVAWFLMSKRQDFDAMETAAKATKVYAVLVVVALLGLAAVMVADWVDLSSRRDVWESFLRSEAPIAVALFGLAVATHGVFASKEKTEAFAGEGAPIDIIKGERLKSYSVADELLKWAKLKEGGHISEEEFPEARKKLLERPPS